MKRKIYDQLLSWKNDKDHKPLVLEGARQVGKTYILKQFGEQEFENMIYINCHNNSFMQTLFEKDFNMERILRAISGYSNQSINEGRTFIFLDEVQDSPRCMESLKYFCEDAREQHIAVAGSLLGIIDHEDESYPVGKINTLQLYPMSFEEFLWAKGEERKSAIQNNCDWSVIASLQNDYEDLLRQYYYVGGMPEAVLDYITNNDVPRIRQIQKEILKNYNNDFSKHAGDETQRIRMVWKSLPSQLAKENKKFIYGVVKKGGRAKEFEKAIQWLVDAGLAYKIHRCLSPTVPLSMYEDPDAFKLYMLDVGLLGALSNMPAALMLANNDIFKEAKGSFTENYVLQQLKPREDLLIYYSSKDNSTQEIDFLVQVDKRIVPVEVKAEENVKSKSLSGYIKTDHKDKQLKGLRCSMKQYRDQEWMENIPLYSVASFFDNYHAIMPMDKSRIESEGIISFSHYINYCTHLDASLNQRDKEPIWDGDLHVYKSPVLTNGNHRGVIRLQVKATTNFDSDAYAKYSVGTDELNAYFRDGGVLFVVVHVARSGNKCFYKMLTPVTISQLLKKAADQKTITITLGPLPQDENDFEEDVFDFVDNSTAQHSFKPDNYSSIMDWNREEPITIEDPELVFHDEKSYLAELKETFDKLHVKDELIFSEIKPNESENGKGLIKAILHGEPVSLTTTPNPVCNVTLGNIMILLKAEKLSDGKTLLTDFFGDMEPITFKDEEGTIIQSSPCIGMTTDDYLKISNVNYDKLVQSFSKSASTDPHLITHANHSLLAMLNAYDRKTGEKEYMIEAIRDLAVWISKNDSDTANKNINKLNILQIVKRHQPLSEQDQEELYVILDSATDNQTKFAVFLLLDEKASAKRYYSKLTEQEQKFIKTLPIWKFMGE